MVFSTLASRERVQSAVPRAELVLEEATLISCLRRAWHDSDFREWSADVLRLPFRARTTPLPEQMFVVFFEGGAWGHERADSIMQFGGPVQRKELLDLMATAQCHADGPRRAQGLPNGPPPTRWITSGGTLEAPPAAARARAGHGVDMRFDILADAVAGVGAGQSTAKVWRVAESGLAFGEMGSIVARARRVALSDRAFHELRVLAESFEMFGCYDQANAPRLARIEAHGAKRHAEKALGGSAHGGSLTMMRAERLPRKKPPMFWSEVACDAGETRAAVAPCGFGSASFPERAHGAADATEVLGAEGRLIIEGWLSETPEGIKPFWDSKLSSDREIYRRFILGLNRRGAIRIECEPALGGGHDYCFTLGVGDVENSCRRLRLPDGVRRRCAPLPTPAKCAPLRGAAAVLDRVRQLGPSGGIADHAEPIALRKGAEVRRALCADDLDVIGGAEPPARPALGAGCAALGAVGLKTHGRELSAGGGEALGCALRGHRLETQDRAAPSAFNARCAVIHRCGDAAAIAWPTVRWGLQSFMGMVPQAGRCSPPAARAAKPAAAAAAARSGAEALEGLSVEEAATGPPVTAVCVEADSDPGSGALAAAAESSDSDDLGDAAMARCKRSERREAAAVIFSFTCYLRPSEVGALDDGLQLGMASLKWLDVVWRGFNSRAAAERAFPFPRQGPLADAQAAGAALVKLVPHHPRHSGASHDRLRNLRGLPDVMKRGDVQLYFCVRTFTALQVRVESRSAAAHTYGLRPEDISGQGGVYKLACERSPHRLQVKVQPSLGLRDLLPGACDEAAGPAGLDRPTIGALMGLCWALARLVEEPHSERVALSSPSGEVPKHLRDLVADRALLQAFLDRCPVFSCSGEPTPGWLKLAEHTKQKSRGLLLKSLFEVKMMIIIALNRLKRRRSELSQERRQELEGVARGARRGQMAAAGFSEMVETIGSDDEGEGGPPTDAPLWQLRDDDEKEAADDAAAGDEKDEAADGAAGEKGEAADSAAQNCEIGFEEECRSSCRIKKGARLKEFARSMEIDDPLWPIARWGDGMARKVGAAFPGGAGMFWKRDRMPPRIQRRRERGDDLLQLEDARPEIDNNQVRAAKFDSFHAVLEFVQEPARKCFSESLAEMQCEGLEAEWVKFFASRLNAQVLSATSPPDQKESHGIVELIINALGFADDANLVTKQTCAKAVEKQAIDILASIGETAHQGKTERVAIGKKGTALPWMAAAQRIRPKDPRQPATSGDLFIENCRDWGFHDDYERRCACRATVYAALLFGAEIRAFSQTELDQYRSFLNRVLRGVSYDSRAKFGTLRDMEGQYTMVDIRLSTGLGDVETMIVKKQLGYIGEAEKAKVAQLRDAHRAAETTRQETHEKQVSEAKAAKKDVPSIPPHPRGSLRSLLFAHLMGEINEAVPQGAGAPKEMAKWLAGLVVTHVNLLVFRMKSERRGPRDGRPRAWGALRSDHLSEEAGKFHQALAIVIDWSRANKSTASKSTQIASMHAQAACSRAASAAFAAWACAASAAPAGRRDWVPSESAPTTALVGGRLALLLRRAGLLGLEARRIHFYDVELYTTLTRSTNLSSTGPHARSWTGPSSACSWRCKRCTGRGAMKFHVTGEALAKDMGVPISVLEQTHKGHFEAGKKTEKGPDGGSFPAYHSGKSWDEASGKTGSGKKFNHNVIDGPAVKSEPFYAAIILPVIHYCMGGLEIDADSACVGANGKAIPGLEAAGDGNNRLGGNSLLDSVAFGRAAGPAAAKCTLGADCKPASLKDLSGGGHAGEVTAPKNAGGSHEDGMNKGAGGVKGYSMEEVAKHASKTDCWMVAAGEVLDATSFLSQRPRGELAILAFAREDATEEFNMIHPPDLANDNRNKRMGECGRVPGPIGALVYMVIAFMKEVLFTIFGRKNFQFTNDHIGPTRSAMFTFIFIITHAVGNLHAFLGPDDFNGYGYFYVRLFWTGFGFNANIVEEYILLASLLHVAVGLKRTWDISINYTIASGKLNIAISGITLLTFMSIHFFQLRFGDTQPFELCPPPCLINVATLLEPRLNLFWVHGADCVKASVRDIYRMEFEVFQSLGWCLFYISAVAIFAAHMRLGRQKTAPAPALEIPKRFHNKAIHIGYIATAFIALVYVSPPPYAHIFPMSIYTELPRLGISKQLRARVVQATVLAALLFGSEIRTISQGEINEYRSFLNRIIRNISYNAYTKEGALRGM
ncbi:unnamed protein product [Prorocentrum cordatum]|uniref:Cytochrome b5 heme-binding domain-containing protein n=1 Tax=Prorocentrum cordatum TaxID=2364126 RepID=A0ABN9TS28_9DINO|nr:unnamed protein product [Polarella glacialis]